MPSNDQSGGVDRVILLFLFALLLFASPVLQWWGAVGAPWYLPYCFWLLVIGLTARGQLKRTPDDL